MSEYRLRSACIASAPIRSAIDVEPTMSQKSTVTGLCSPSGASGAGVPASRASAAPQ